MSIHVRPRSSRTAIVGVREGALDVALTAPPVDGQANAMLSALLAEALGVRKSDVLVVQGGHGRNKVVEIAGLSPGALRERIGSLP